MIDNRIIQITMLLLSIPFQYLLIQYLSKTNISQSIIESDSIEAQKHRISVRDAELKEVISACSSWFSLSDWHVWLLELQEKLTGTVLHSKFKQKSDTLDSEISFENKLGLSKEPRLYRPNIMIFSIGQVVYHKHWKYRGVIVGWDAVGKAPDDWFKAMYPADKLEEWKQQPTYRILIDTRDRFAPQISYIPQDNLALEMPVKRIMHPHLDEYFEGFDGQRYLPRPWFRDIYPYG